MDAAPTRRTGDTAITVSWMTARGTQEQARRTAAFCIGHDAYGELSVDDQQVTRAHTAVFLRDGQWWARDLSALEGTSLNGAPFQSAPLPRRAVLALGGFGVQVMLEVEGLAAGLQRGPAASAQASSAVTGTAPYTAPGAAPRPGAGGTAGSAAGGGGWYAGAGAHTVLASSVRSPKPGASNAVPPIRVQVGTEPAREFTDTVRIGRSDYCTIRIEHDGVSRNHLELFRMGNQWCARDLGSGNGTFMDGERIDQTTLPARCTISLGVDGPKLEVSYAAPASARSEHADSARSIEDVAAHYFDEKSGAPAGNHTMMVRKAFTTVQRKQKRRYGSVIAGALGLLLIAVGVGIYQHFQLERTRELAEQLFYNMKTVELQLARLEEQVQASADDAHRAEAERGRAQLAEMASQYDGLLRELGVLDKNLAPEERIILNVARELGECELGMPEEFVDEVKRYIGIWRSDQRLAKALRKANEQNLPPVITQIMREHHLPPQFFFVALQESDFRPDAVGPTTRFGIAKGMWQLMPATAAQYGLRNGPLQELPDYDPDDERFDPSAATQAAARYLGDLYRGEAQASGLLVLASYNWGTTRVRNRIREMQENPRDRNFWKFLAQHEVPTETRNYVFMIFAAAVISEDPKLFGFEFDPLLLN
jgi:membrane-bound lytic murein transglycosylase D